MQIGISGPVEWTFNRKSLRQLILGILLVAMMAPLRALAQSGAGSIQGTVKDISGAAVPNAMVRISNDANGTAVDTTTNKVGFYIAPELFVGAYTITINAPGLAKNEQHIRLAAGQSAVMDATLSLEGVKQQVTVQGEFNQLATYDSPTVSSTLENSRIQQLPINGRSISALVGLTTPGVEGDRVNGNEAPAFEYIQDGAALVDRNFGGASLLPDQDSIQEVRVETSNSSAKLDRPATAILTTKSGTNSIHGSFFETARNNYIGIAKSRQDPSDLKAPHLVRNEFGGSVGGPIFLPKLYDGHNKSFFFLAYERLSLRQSTSALLRVPTVANRIGDFSDLVNTATGAQLPIYDSQTSDPVTFARKQYNFGGPAGCALGTPVLCSNKIDPSRISPLAKNLLAITQLPNIPNANPQFAPNINVPVPNNSTAPNTTFRLDQHFSDRNSTYLRFTDTSIHTLTASTSNGPPTTDGTFNTLKGSQTVLTGAVGYTHVFSPTFFAETLFSNQWEESFFPTISSAPPLDYNKKYGLPDNFPVNFTPNILGTPYQKYGEGSFISDSQIISVLDENLTKIVGRHQFQFGGRYRHERIGISPDQNPPQVSFGSESTGLVNPASLKNKSYTQLPNTGFAGADFFLGAASEYVQRLNEGYLHFRDQEVATYLQDDFHATSRLTLNLGIRWEIHPAVTEEHNSFSSFDLANHAIVLGEPIPTLIARGVTTQAIITNLQNLGVNFENAQQAGLPGNLTYGNDFTFSPRVGAAYRLSDKNNSTVIRGGYARYIYPIATRNFYVSTRGSAPFSETYQQNYTTADQSPDGQPNYLLRTPQTDVAGLNSSNAVNTSTTNSILPGVEINYLNPHFPVTYVTQGNVTLEQPIKSDNVVRLTYSYDHGSNLEQDDLINQAPSTYIYEKVTGHLPPTGFTAKVATNPYNNTAFGTITQINKSGYSTDNSFQVNFQRLYKHGYAYQFFYVFSSAQRIGGNGPRDGYVPNAADFLPGFLPGSGSYDDINRFEWYQTDSAIPRHRYRFNGIVDLPVGRGKHFFGNVNRFVDELIGGYQIAGLGTVFSQAYQPTQSLYGPINGIKVMKHARKIQDCRSGTCYPSYEYFNGSIAPTYLSGGAAYAAGKGVTGLPSNYVPFQQPIGYNLPVTNPDYFTDNVPVTLSNGTVVPSVPYSPGPGTNPFSKTFLQGPFNYTVDLSLFKVFPITETAFVRINVDAFNAFNVQGYNNPDGTSGIESLRSSYNTPRQLQFTARFTF